MKLDFSSHYRIIDFRDGVIEDKIRTKVINLNHEEHLALDYGALLFLEIR